MSLQILQEQPRVPPNWVITDLEHLVEILDSERVPINSKERERRKGNIPYYGATGQVGWIDDYLFDEELLLLGEDGAPFFEHRKEKAYIIRGKSWVNNHAHVLRALPAVTSNIYLCHYLNIFRYDGYVGGTTRPKLNQSPMRRIPVPLAPLNEQKRIVSKIEELFTKLDAGVESLKKAKLQLKRYRQSVLKAAFEGKLTEEWRKKHKDEIEPISQLLERIRSTKVERRKGISVAEPLALFKLPDEWRWITVADIAERIQYGTSEKASVADSGIPVLRMGNIQDGKIDFSDVKYLPPNLPQLQTLILEDGDLLFNRTNSKELVGKVAVYRDSYPKAAFASYLIRVKTKREFYEPDILSYFINSSFGRLYINSVVSQQVGQANVNGTKLSMMPIPLLPVSEQKVLLSELQSSFSIADETERTIEYTIRGADRLRQSILKQAFQGKLVPQDPNDEPAEKLLARIRMERESKANSAIQQKLILGVESNMVS